MTIKTKLFIGTAVEAILVLFLSGLLIILSQQLAAARHNETQTAKIAETVSQLRYVSFEHVLHFEERSYEQWQSKYGQLSELLKPTDRASSEAHVTYAHIAKLQQEIEVIFEQIIQVGQAANPTVAQTNLKERLISQLLIKQQEQIRSAFDLATHSQAAASSLTTTSSAMTILVVMSMLLITLVNYFLLTRTISRSLAGLQKGANMIAVGNFDYHIHPTNPKDEFGKVAQAFNAMAASAGNLDRQKTEFILLASHQLRTPLTAVKWYSEALLSYATTIKDSKLEKYTSQVARSNERMIVLVDKLLDAARAESGKWEAQPQLVHPNGALQQALDNLNKAATSNNVKITTVIDKDVPEIYIDPSWLAIIFENLLSNAVRYSPAGKTVHITIKKQSKYLLISIADSGYGIPASQRNKIFTKLFRANNAKQAIGEGSGLDLYITKTVVGQAGGTIWFSSVEDKGTTFYVSLPIGEPAPTTEPVASKEVA